MKYIIFTVLLSFSTSSFAIPELSQNLMVTGPSRLALESALRVGKDGGNPADVAVAYALTLAVTHPYFGALGGGGFAMINMNGTPEALDFREEAPSKTHKDYFLKDRNSKRASWTGGAAVGVPGVPMGLWELHQKHGSKPWKSLFKEALHYSKKGFPVSGEWYKVTKKESKRFWKPGTKHLLINNKVPLPGDLLKQPGLYKALKKLKNHGPKGFYEGDVAKDISSSVKASNGDMSLDDLKNYTAKWRKPLTAEFEGGKVFLMPPPSSGGVVIKTALELVKKQNLKKYELLGLTELHLLGEIMSASFRGRALLGDPDFHNNPLNFLLGKDYINKLNKRISKYKTAYRKPLSEKKLPKESTQTTHFVVMNKKGQAVSITTTLNGNYGSGVVSEKFGVALNNEMDDFTTKPGKPNFFGLVQGNGNVVKAKKRPLSSMSPTIVLNDKNETVLALGAPGGPRIINGVFQTLYRTMANDLNMEQAIFTPRLHHQFLPRVLRFEENRFSPYVLNGLRKRGHKLKHIHGVAITYGVKKNAEGLLEGAADYRGEGYTGGF
ncbi:MAG: gamma-glutamyltransferase [Bdellovibrionales bacterium]